MTEDELTVHAEEVIGRLMDAVAAFDPVAVGRALDGAPLLHVTVGLAYGLHQQEVANEALTERITVLTAISDRLSGERAELRDKVRELRALMDAGAEYRRRGTARAA